MNVPGRAAGNWRWRCTEDMLSPSAFQWLRDLTETSNRSAFCPGRISRAVRANGDPRYWPCTPRGNDMKATKSSTTWARASGSTTSPATC